MAKATLRCYCTERHLYCVDPVGAGNCHPFAVARARYLAEPEVLEAGLALHTLVRVVEPCEEPRCGSKAEIIQWLLALDPHVQVIEKAL